jgi:hypothetical protein
MDSGFLLLPITFWLRNIVLQSTTVHLPLMRIQLAVLAESLSASVAECLLRMNSLQVLAYSWLAHNHTNNDIDMHT